MLTLGFRIFKIQKRFLLCVFIIVSFQKGSLIKYSGKFFSTVLLVTSKYLIGVFFDNIKIKPFKEIVSAGVKSQITSLKYFFNLILLKN